MTTLVTKKTTPIFCPKCHRQALTIVEDGGIIEIKMGERTQIRTRRGSISNIGFGCPHCRHPIRLFKDAETCHHEFHKGPTPCIHCGEPFDDRIDK